MEPAQQRISDEERQQVADVLRQAAGEGRIDADELENRLEATFTAKTYGDLVPITADLPADSTRPLPVRRPADHVVAAPAYHSSFAMMSTTRRRGRWQVGAQHKAFGLMGGDMQPQGHAQVIVNLVDFDMNLQEAGDAPRFHHTGSSEPTGTVMTKGGVLHIEDGIPDEVRADLARRGHVLLPEAVGAYGGYQAIRRDPRTGVYTGATEKRKDGCAMGY